MNNCLIEMWLNYGKCLNKGIKMFEKKGNNICRVWYNGLYIMIIELMKIF